MLLSFAGMTFKNLRWRDNIRIQEHSVFTMRLGSVGTAQDLVLLAGNFPSRVNAAL